MSWNIKITVWSFQSGREKFVFREASRSYSVTVCRAAAFHKEREGAPKRKTPWKAPFKQWPWLCPDQGLLSTRTPQLQLMSNPGIAFHSVNNIIVTATNTTPYIVGSTHDLGFVWPVGDLNWRAMSGLKFNSVSEKLCHMAGKSVMLQYRGTPAPLNVIGRCKGESEKSSEK